MYTVDLYLRVRRAHQLDHRGVKVHQRLHFAHQGSYRYGTNNGAHRQGQWNDSGHGGPEGQQQNDQAYRQRKVQDPPEILLYDPVRLDLDRERAHHADFETGRCPLGSGNRL